MPRTADSIASVAVAQRCTCPWCAYRLGSAISSDALSLGAQVGEIEPRVEQTNQQFEEAAAAQRAAERNLRQLHSKVEKHSSSGHGQVATSLAVMQTVPSALAIC